LTIGFETIISHYEQEVMKKFRICFLMLILLILSGCLASCINSKNKAPAAIRGVIDLSSYDFERDGPATMSGEWEFYWQRYLGPEDFRNPIAVEEKSFIYIPGGWHRFLSWKNNLPGNGYATLRLTVLTKTRNEKLSLDISYVRSACTVYINGKETGSAGQIITSFNPEIEAHSPHNIMSLVSKGGKTEIIVLVSNYHMAYGGIWDPVLLGYPDSIAAKHNAGHNLAAFMFGGFVIIGVYNLILFMIRRDDRVYIYFGLLSFASAVWILISQQYFIYSLFAFMSWEIVTKIECVDLVFALILFGRLIQQQFKDEFNLYPSIIMEAFGAGIVVLVLLIESDKYIHIIQAYFLAAFIFLAYVLWVLFKALKNKRNAAATLLTSSIILIFTLINDFGKRNGIVIFDEYLSQYGLLIFTLVEAFIISHLFLFSYRREEDLSRGIPIKMEGLEKTQNHLNALYNSLSPMLISSNGEGRIIHSNLAAQKHLSILSDNKISQVIWDLKPFPKELKTKIRRAFLSRTSFESKGERFEENERANYNITLKPCTYEKVDGAVLRIDDITELEKKDEQLKHAQQMEAIGILAGGLAHDFKNILTGITGTIALVSHSATGGEKNIPKTLERLALIEQTSDKAGILVSRLMALAKRQDFSCTAVDLNQLIDNIVNISRNTFDKSVAVITEYYPGKSYIYADSMQIEQVMLNLILNAYQAMTIMRKDGEKWGGVLKIVTSRINPDSQLLSTYPMLSGSYCWAVDVSDTGVGMDENTKKRIFEPFFTTKKTGTGLGLVMVSNIIQQHGGVIEVESGKNAGVVFRIILPLYSPHIMKIQEPVHVELPKGEGLILLAENDDILKKSTRDILSIWGYKVIVVEEGVEALKIFRKRQSIIKGVIMNLSLPRISGKELYNEIMKIDSDVKVIAVSGMRPDPDIFDTLRKDGNGFIEMPYSMMELLKKCHDIFSSRGGE
jgi:nitrogen-specific signal transduction histidine kinase/CheY-like chemotaxis protein